MKIERGRNRGNECANGKGEMIDRETKKKVERKRKGNGERKREKDKEGKGQGKEDTTFHIFTPAVQYINRIRVVEMSHTITMHSYEDSNVNTATLVHV